MSTKQITLPLPKEFCQRANEKAEIHQLTEAEKLASQDKTISSESILTHVQQLNITH